MFKDRSLICKECGAEFVFTQGEQEFFWTKGFDNQPNRCPSCRRIRRDRSSNHTNSNFDAQQMFEVPCSRCGNITQVPFIPDGRKPVYCRECLQQYSQLAKIKPRLDRGFIFIMSLALLILTVGSRGREKKQDQNQKDNKGIITTYATHTVTHLNSSFYQLYLN